MNFQNFESITLTFLTIRIRECSATSGNCAKLEYSKVAIDDHLMFYLNLAREKEEMSKIFSLLSELIKKSLESDFTIIPKIHKLL